MPFVRSRRAIALVRFRSLPRALLGLVEAMLHLWPLIVFSLIAPVALTFNSQGRQVLQMATIHLFYYFFGGPIVFVAVGLVIITIYARLLTEQTALLSRPQDVRRYALYTAPQLLGILAAFVLPLMVHYGAKLKLVDVERSDSYVLVLTSFRLQVLHLH